MKYIDICEKMELLKKINEKCTIPLPGPINMMRRRNIDILKPEYEYYMNETKAQLEKHATLLEDGANYKFNSDAEMHEFLTKRDQLNDTESHLTEDDLKYFDSSLLETLMLTPELFDILYMFSKEGK